MPIINVDIIWSKKTYDDIKLKNGQIVIEKGEIWMKGQMTSSEWRVFSGAYPANIDLLADFKKSMRFENANLDGRKIRVNVQGTYILYRHSVHYLKGYTDLSYKLTEISYPYSCDKEDCYAILDIPFMHLTNNLSDLNHYPEDIFLSNNDHEYRLCFCDDDKTMLLGVVDNESYLDDLLVHMSFYFNLIPNIFISSFNCSGRTIVHCKAHKFPFPNESLYHSELPYLLIGERNDFNYFFANSHWYSLDSDNKRKLKNAIYTFARCKYCDDATQFLLLYSIFDRFVGKYNTTQYKEMKSNFLRYNIDIGKIGEKTDKRLQKLQLILERSNGKKVVVDNFCLLRHYILHFMSNAEIDEYISHSNLIDKMRFTATIIILNEMGFSNVKFRADWDYLSVIIDS
jgi:hypothetical protein